MFELRRITLFCLEKRLSNHKMTVFSKKWGVHGLFAPPGYAYDVPGNVYGFWLNTSSRNEEYLNGSI